MATELKFCGTQWEADILAASACLPDYIGLVFTAGARRTVSPETVRELRGAFDSRVRAVGIFMDQSPEEITEIMAQAPLDRIRLHGNESEESLGQVHALIGRPVWRAFQVTGNEVLVRTEESRVDLLPFNSDKGSSKAFAQEWLRGFFHPYALTGGLDAKNIGETIRTLSPREVDASSALETGGQKDSERARVFTEAVHRADSETERQNHGTGDRERRALRRPWRTIYPGNPDECGD